MSSSGFAASRLRRYILWFSLAVMLLSGAWTAGLGALFGTLIASGGVLSPGDFLSGTWAQRGVGLVVFLMGVLPFLLAAHLAVRAWRRRPVSLWVVLLAWSAAVFGLVIASLAFVGNAPDPTVVFLPFVAGLWGYLLGPLLVSALERASR